MYIKAADVIEGALKFAEGRQGSVMFICTALEHGLEELFKFDEYEYEGAERTYAEGAYEDYRDKVENIVKDLSKYFGIDSGSTHIDIMKTFGSANLPAAYGFRMSMLWLMHTVAIEDKLIICTNDEEVFADDEDGEMYNAL